MKFFSYFLSSLCFIVFLGGPSCSDTQETAKKEQHVKETKKKRSSGSKKKDNRRQPKAQTNENTGSKNFGDNTGGVEKKAPRTETNGTKTKDEQSSLFGQNKVTVKEKPKKESKGQPNNYSQQNTFSKKQDKQPAERNLGTGSHQEAPKVSLNVQNQNKAKKDLADKSDASSTKVLFVFPAGAGAGIVSTLILEVLEAQFNTNAGNLMDMAAGVSSGSIVAAGITYNNSAFSAAKLTADTDQMMQKVFPGVKELFATLRSAGIEDKKLSVLTKKISLGQVAELKTLASSFANGIDFSNPMNLFGLGGTLQSLGLDIADGMKLFGHKDQLSQIFASLEALVNPKLRKAALKEAILDIFDQRFDKNNKDHKNFTLHMEENNRFMSLASYGGEKVLFASSQFVQNLSDMGYNVVVPHEATVYNALGSSAAIPNFIHGSKSVWDKKDINKRLTDGVGALDTNTWDPSSLFYEIFKQLYPNDDLLIVYVGNGCETDSDFRKSIGFNFKQGVAKVDDNNRSIEFVSLEPDLKGLFSLAVIYPHGEVETAIRGAVAQLVRSSPSFRNAVELIKTAKNL